MEEEDWDNPTSTTATKTPAAPQSSSAAAAATDNAQQTLKITDGYKYSYEALTSPANVEDWVDPPTYASSKRMPNGFSQNSFRDSNKPYRSERSGGDNYKRFEKRNSSYSNPSGGDFVAPKPRYSRPLPNVNPTDWDAPVNAPATPINGSFNVNVPMTTAEDAWDALGAGTPHSTHSSHSITHHKSTPIATFNQAKPVAEDEDWDNPGGLASQPSVTPPAEIPTYRPSSVASISMHSTHSEPIHVASSQSAPINDEENWDDPGTPMSSSQVVMPTFRSSSVNSNFPPNTEEDWEAGPSTANADNGFSKNIPPYPASGADDPYSSQRYDNNWQSNKYSRPPRNFDSNDHFSRDPFSRHSRGNFRNNTFDRGSRGSRGPRGSRGSRGGRDFNSSFNSRDRDRERAYSHSPFGKSNDRPYQSPASAPISTAPAPAEEDWDKPSGASKEPTEKSTAPTAQSVASPGPAVIVAPPPVPTDESWD